MEQFENEPAQPAPPVILTEHKVETMSSPVIPPPAPPVDTAETPPIPPPVPPPVPPVSKKKSMLFPILLIILALILFVGGAVLFLWQKQKSVVSEPSIVEAPPAEALAPIAPDNVLPVNEMPIVPSAPEKSDALLIKDAMAEKYSKNSEEVSLGVREITLDYAVGSVKFAGDTGGGWWLAAKVDGKWVIVADGNGTVMCADVEPYLFPTSMVWECYDESTEQLIQF